MLRIRQETIDECLEQRFYPKSITKKRKRGKPRKPRANVKRNRIKRTTFNHTPLGDFLMKNCPVEYELIQKTKKEGFSVSADLIEEFAYHSDNPAFQSVEFRKVLADYRRYKCKTPNKVQFNLEAEIAAIKRRLNIE